MQYPNKSFFFLQFEVYVILFVASTTVMNLLPSILQAISEHEFGLKQGISDQVNGFM